ncbi:MAG: hypothetical protein HY056_04340 [Proteobacteria bacterium]|nr:hypothetical protein [Pseudomonadota bacterium]
MNDHWLTRERSITRLWIVFIAILTATVLADLTSERHAQFGADGTFAFGAWFGFASCVVLIGLAKALGYLLKRADTYYGD